MSLCLQSCFKVAAMSLWYWWLLLCSKQGQYRTHESLFCLSLASFTSVSLCVQTHCSANEDTKVFLKLFQKASVPFSFFRRLIRGADRWQVWWRAKGKILGSGKCVSCFLKQNHSFSACTTPVLQYSVFRICYCMNQSQSWISELTVLRFILI